MKNLVISNHAYKRARDRLKWKSKTLDKMAEVAYNKGIKHKDTKGRLKKYIDKIFFEYKIANNVRIYGDIVYVFSNKSLITIYSISNNLKKLI